MRTFPVGRDGDHKEFWFRWSIDNAEWETLNQDATGFLERRSATQRMVAGAQNSCLDSSLKANTRARSSFGVVSNLPEHFNLCCWEEANFGH